VGGMSWPEVSQRAMSASLHLKAVVPIVLSIIALWVSLRDRRPRLTPRQRKGEWCKLKPTLNQAQVIFMGVVEVYNVSARANAIRDYEFWEKRVRSNWVKMESGFYQQSISNEDIKKANVTPLTLEPYSGCEIDVMAFTKMPQPYEMQVRVRVQDLFGNWFQVEVKATS